MKRYGRPASIITDRLRSYRAAMKVIGNEGRQETRRWLNNWAENSHQPFRRRERAMAKFREVRTLQKFASVHASIHNHFNHQRHLNRRDIFKQDPKQASLWGRVIPKKCARCPTPAMIASVSPKSALRMTRRVRQRHEHLPQTTAPFANVILHNGLAARKPMLVAKTLEAPLRRVPLLAVNRSFHFQNKVDDIRERGQLRALRRLASPISRWFRMAQHLPHRLTRYAKPTGRFALAYPINMTGKPNS